MIYFNDYLIPTGEVVLSYKDNLIYGEIYITTCNYYKLMRLFVELNSVNFNIKTNSIEVDNVKIIGEPFNSNLQNYLIISFTQDGNNK